MIALKYSGLLLAALLSTASGEPRGWTYQDGSPAPDTDARKSAGGLGGWLIVTSDANWQEKWETPEHVVPSFNEAESVKVGQTVWGLIFLVNPKLNENDEVRIRCGIKVTRPDGTLSVDVPDLSCLEGSLPGKPNSVLLAVPVLPFIGEPGDPKGPWTFEVELRDLERPVSLPLRTVVGLE